MIGKERLCHTHADREAAADGLLDYRLLLGPLALL